MTLFANGRFRAGDSAVAPPTATGGSQMRIRASDVAAPTTPALPIVPPSPGTRPFNLFSGGLSLLIWMEPPIGHASLFLDYSVRWRKHLPKINDTLPPSGLIGVDPLGAGVFVDQSPVSSGTGTLLPYLSIDGIAEAPLIDIQATPIFCFVVLWELDGPLREDDGTLVVLTSSSPTLPAVPAMQIQPIIGDQVTDGPWLLYVEWEAEWVGVPGDWALIPTASLTLSHGTTPRVTTSRVLRGKPGEKIGEMSYVELDNTSNHLRLNKAGTLPTVGQPGGWPASHILGASEVGDIFSDFRQVNGNIVYLAIVSLTIEESVKLVSDRSVVPGTGAPMTSISFRAKDSVLAGLPSRLSEYAHYWPLDDAASPMVDLVAGSRLNVVNPSLATFRVGGITNPLSPTHTRALHLARASDDATAAAAYLQWDAAAPNPSIGTGALGHDLTLSCWIRWEGPPIGIELVAGLGIFRGTNVPFGMASEPSLDVQVPFVAEPFGLHFQTADSVVPTFEVLSTPGFDWPNDVSFDNLLVPHKSPVWALLAVVMRSVAGQMRMEIWMDGSLIAEQDGSNNGWGVDATLQYVAQNFAPCTIQHLTFWPFALTADELAAVTG